MKKNILCVQHSAINVSDGILSAGALRCVLCGVSVVGPTCGVKAVPRGSITLCKCLTEHPPATIKFPKGRNTWEK